MIAYDALSSQAAEEFLCARLCARPWQCQTALQLPHSRSQTSAGPPLNHFFYKKLTETSGDGGGGPSAAGQRKLAAGGQVQKTAEELGYDRVRKWTRVRDCLSPFSPLSPISPLSPLLPLSPLR